MGTRRKRGAFLLFFFLFLLPARANTTAAVEHCGEGELSRRLSLYLCLPQLCEALLMSGSCFLLFTLSSFLRSPFSIILFPFLLSQRFYAVFKPPGACSYAQRLRGKQEHTLSSFLCFNGTPICSINHIFVFHCILACTVMCYSVCIAVLITLLSFIFDKENSFLWH